MLWTAPELLRQRDAVMGTPEGDVYSFAIICSEVVTRKAAWQTCEVKNAEGEWCFMNSKQKKKANNCERVDDFGRRKRILR